MQMKPPSEKSLVLDSSSCFVSLFVDEDYLGVDQVTCKRRGGESLSGLRLGDFVGDM
jgi:hypothetical protein